MQLWGATKTLTLDSEFQPDSLAITWLGIKIVPIDTTAGTVYGFPFDWEYAAWLRGVCEDPTYLKILHNAAADIRVLANAGIKVVEPIWDTMLAAYVLNPTLEVGLNDVARLNVPAPPVWWLKIKAGRKSGEQHSKEDEARYNAADVDVTHRIFHTQLAECNARPVSPLAEIEARCKLLGPIMAMESDGMRVDVATQQAMIKQLRAEIEATETAIEERVKGLWAGRVEGALMEARVKDEFAQQVSGEGTGQCPKHPKANGMRKPGKCLACWAIYDAAAPLRDRIKAARADRNKAKGRVLKWQEGFNWASSEHLGWLLYTALGLPEQINHKTKKRTTDSKAIDTLATKVEEARTGGKTRSKYYKSEEEWGIVRDIKETQHKDKQISTFLDLPLTDDGYLRWPNLSYKIHGTETGRLAGGEDKEGERDKLRAVGNSVMNIPKFARRIYIPPPHHCFIGSDAVNQEGRSYAWLTQDVNYLAMLAEELNGGHKVHARTAALIYDIDPADAKKVKVNYRGTEITAYEGGKRGRHAWSYSYRPIGMLMGNYGMALKQAVRVVNVLDEMHPQAKAEKERLVTEILGRYVVDVGKTGAPRAALVQPGRRTLSNPFGWTRTFYGMGKVITDPLTGRKEAVPAQANDVLAFGPQSIGASVWCRVVRQLWERGLKVVTGQYDSVLVAAQRDPGIVRETITTMTEVLEQPWPQMGGYRFKWEFAVGMNWGDYSESNPEGLRSWGEEE